MCEAKPWCDHVSIYADKACKTLLQRFAGPMFPGLNGQPACVIYGNTLTVKLVVAANLMGDEAKGPKPWGVELQASAAVDPGQVAALMQQTKASKSAVSARALAVTIPASRRTKTLAFCWLCNHGCASHFWRSQCERKVRTLVVCSL